MVKMGCSDFDYAWLWKLKADNGVSWLWDAGEKKWKENWLQ